MAKIEMEAKLWTPPNFVTVEGPEDAEGIRKTISVPIEDIPDDAFHALVEEWVEAIYVRAGKHRPARGER
jgi:hypothetical protein